MWPELTLPAQKCLVLPAVEQSLCSKLAEMFLCCTAVERSSHHPPLPLRTDTGLVQPGHSATGGKFP